MTASQAASTPVRNGHGQQFGNTTHGPYERSCVQVVRLVEVEQTGEIWKLLVANSEPIGTTNLNDVDDIMADFVVFPALKTNTHFHSGLVYFGDFFLVFFSDSLEEHTGKLQNNSGLYLTHRTKSPLIELLSLTRNTPLSRSAISVLFASSRLSDPKYQLKIYDFKETSKKRSTTIALAAPNKSQRWGAFYDTASLESNWSRWQLTTIVKHLEQMLNSLCCHLSC